MGFTPAELTADHVITPAPPSRRLSGSGTHADGGDATTTPPRVIFGIGAIALATLDALRRRGGTVRLVNRSGHASMRDDVEGWVGKRGIPRTPATSSGS
jgi:hypothetical protein